MADNENFDVEDLLQNDLFISWVLHPTKTENDFWDNWLLEFPERKTVVDRARKILLAVQAEPVSPPVTNADIDDVMAFVAQHGYPDASDNKPTGKIIVLRWLKVAAILFVALSVSLIFYSKRNEQKPTVKAAELVQWMEIKNQSGNSRVIRMEDGSLAILKPNSALRCPNTFTDATRDVFLEGEAFFEVHKNPRKPFLVHSQNMVTKVLGTSFTVRAFKNDKNFKVVVNTGRVMVYTVGAKVNTGGHSVLILPHQQVTLNRKASELVKDTVKATMLLAKETAKKEFAFVAAGIPEVIQKLEDAYHVNISYDARQFQHVTVTAALSDLPLDEKVKFICKAVDAQCSFNDGQITIRKN